MKRAFIASMGALAVVIALLELTPGPVAGPTALGSFVGVAEAGGGGAQAPPATAKTETGAKRVQA